MAKAAVKKEKSEQILSTKKLTKVKKEKKKDKEVLKSKPAKENIEKVLKKKKSKELKLKSDELPVTTTDDAGSIQLKVSTSVIEKAITAMKKGFEKTSGANAKENLFSSEVRYGMQVVFVKIPKMPSHNRKM